MSVQVKRLEVADPQKGNRDAAVNSPTTTMTGDTELAREDFFHQLGIARQRYYKLRADGRLPEPPRLPGTTIIKWTPRYLKQCQTALARLRAENRRRLGLRAKDLKKAGLI